MRFSRFLPFILSLAFFVLSFIILNNSSVKIERLDDKVPGAFDALSFWTQQRAYPNKNLSDGKFLEAFESYQLNKLEKPNSIITDPWTTIGPHNSGGRTLAIEFNPGNPNTLWAGSASGGLWRSFTMGVGVDAWHRLDTKIPVLGVSSIAISPADTNLMFIGTGEVYNYEGVGTGAAYRNTRGTYGVGILKTTDGGVTWTKSLDWDYGDQKGVWAVKFNPLNPNTVWATTTEGTYRSYDAGNSWQLVHNVVMANDIVINNVDTNIVITGNGNFESPGYGIYRTSDGGSNWTKITSGLPTTYEGKIQLAIYDADPNIVFASIGNGFTSANGASWLCKSTNAGLTWAITTTTDYSKWQGWFSHDVAINPTDPNKLTVIGIDVWTSTNGGNFITQKSVGGVAMGTPPIGGQEGGPTFVHSDNHDVKYHPTDPNLIYFASDGGIYRSTDGGSTFESRNGRYQTHQFYSGFATSTVDSNIVMGGLQDNGTVMYSGTLAWTRTNGGDGSWTAIEPGNDNIRFTSWQYLNMLRSSNGGSSWQSNITPPGAAITAFIAPYRISNTGTQVIYAGRDKIYRSTNYGNSWSATNSNNSLDGNPAFTMDLSDQSDDVLYVATAPFTNRSGIWRTTNGGASWSNITGSLPDRFPNDLEVDPNDDQTVYVTFSGFGTSHVFKSTDGGDNWMDMSTGLPDVPTSALVVDPFYSNHIYVGNDIGVFASTDGGNTWMDYSEGLPRAVLAMDIVVTPVNKKLRIATHGNGAYERDLLSKNLTAVNNEIVVEDFILEQNYPNPFNPTTKISWQSPVGSHQSLVVYDLLGNKIATLVNEYKPTGNYEVEFNASELASGTYFYKLTAGNYEVTKKMLLIK